jgi:hypothetical protein
VLESSVDLISFVAIEPKKESIEGLALNLTSSGSVSTF